MFGSNHTCIDELLKTAIAAANADKKQSGGAGAACVQFVTNPTDILRELTRKTSGGGARQAEKWSTIGALAFATVAVAFLPLFFHSK